MSEKQNKDWQLEQKRVDMVIDEINKKVKKLDKHAGKVSSEVLELRKSFWEDVTVNLDEPDDVIETAASMKQQAELLSERERTHHQADRQLKILDRLKFSPYFGRIDFLENGEEEKEKIYLGIASLMDEHDENFLIYDWRAPISSIYYDYSPGPAEYHTLDGMIKGEMELKRQFIIRAGQIKGMFDTGVTIGDEILQEVLGNNASTQMKSIVATIQREQNQIIRNEKSKYLIVQGVAGSGKTSAAMQRVAYLLYRYRETLKSENIMLFSPNPLFNSYVATVLPELGEENMQQATFLEYLHERIKGELEVEDNFEQMEFLLNEKETPDYSIRVKGIQFKASLQFKELIDRYCQVLSNHKMLFKDFSFRGDTIISKQLIQEYFYSLDSSFSIPNRLEMVKEWLLKELKRKLKQETAKDWVQEEIQFLEKEDFLEAYKHLQQKQQFTDNSFDDFEQEQKFLARMVVKEKFKPLFVRIKKDKFIDMPGIYQQLFREPCENVPAEWKDICRQSLEKLTGSELAFEDATPYVYLQDLILGRKSSTAIRHVFIDEAQDYTPFQFAFIQRLFPFSKMTLLGDFNQAIFSGATGSETVLTDLPLEGDSVERFALTKTYRSTKEIVEFTSSIIRSRDLIEPFNRYGKKPSIERVHSQNLHEALIFKIREFIQEGHKTIAVICRTAQESKFVFEALKNIFPVHLIEKGTVSYERGILVIPSYLSKGIEFDAVILSDSSKYRKESERKLLYTVCTRAMHELHLLTTDGISPLLECVPRDTYQLME